MSTATTEARPQSTSLVYKTKKTKGNRDYYIIIKLDDECRNGHQDFAITGDIIEAGKPRIDTHTIVCGAIGDEIAKEFPEFEIFNRLHLCDYDGVPMHGVANGYYHLNNGFDRVPINGPGFSAMFCEYYRITTGQFDQLIRCESKMQYAMKLIEMGVLDQWKAEAQTAIKILEEWTGKQFVNNSTRSNFEVTLDSINREKELIASGYYTPEAVAERAAKKAEYSRA